ncbi:COQ9 family protein [soil metagenome]
MRDPEHGTEAETDPIAEARAKVLAAALAHVPFDGWSDRTLAYGVEDAGVDPGTARLAFPRGGVDLALAFHYARDAALADRLAAEDLAGLRFRDKLAHALVLRLELMKGEREAVRRAASLFALPHHAAEGARALWHTADTVWTALGDESRDYNWYTKRATLSGVYSSALLYWLGDETPDMEATRGFVGRRIDDVMRIEDVKARVKGNRLAAAVLKGPQRLLDRVRAPGDNPAPGLPGLWHGTTSRGGRRR